MPGPLLSPSEPPVLIREAAVPERSWRDRAAAGLSYGINPVLWPPLLFGLVLGHFGAPASEVGYGILVGVVFFGLIPLAYVLRLLRQGRIGSIEMPRRADRTRPLLVCLASCVAALWVLHTGGATAARLLVAVGLLYAANTLVICLINLRWKISLHLSALAGFVSVLLFVARTAWPGLEGPPLLHPEPLALLVLPLLLLMWARVHVGAHTWPQVLAGTVFGLAAPYAELYLLLRSGFLNGL